VPDYDAVVRTSRAAAIALTALALALINAALAYLIVRVAGFTVLGPPVPVAVAVLAAGVLVAAGAVAEWRKYLRRG
jgi:hypothetical protein